MSEQKLEKYSIKRPLHEDILKQFLFQKIWKHEIHIIFHIHKFKYSNVPLPNRRCELYVELARKKTNILNFRFKRRVVSRKITWKQ